MEPLSCGEGVNELSTPEGCGAPVVAGEEVLILEISGSEETVDMILGICEMELKTVDVVATAGGTDAEVDDVDVVEEVEVVDS